MIIKINQIENVKLMEKIKKIFGILFIVAGILLIFAGVTAYVGLDTYARDVDWLTIVVIHVLGVAFLTTGIPLLFGDKMKSSRVPSHVIGDS